MPTYCIALIAVSALFLLLALALIIALLWARRTVANINHRLDESSRSHAACLVNIASQEYFMGSDHDAAGNVPCCPRYVAIALQERVKVLENDRDADNARISRRLKGIDDDIVELSGSIGRHQDMVLEHDEHITNLNTNYEIVGDRLRIVEASKRPSAIPVPTPNLEQKLSGYQKNMTELKEGGLEMGRKLDKQNAAINKSGTPYQGIPKGSTKSLKENSSLFNTLATKLNGAISSPVKAEKSHAH